MVVGRIGGGRVGGWVNGGGGFGGEGETRGSCFRKRKHLSFLQNVCLSPSLGTDSTC